MWRRTTAIEIQEEPRLHQGHTQAVSTPAGDPPAQLRPHSPSHWKGPIRAHGRGGQGQYTDWKNKGVKKVEAQCSFKAFLAHKKEVWR